MDGVICPVYYSTTEVFPSIHLFQLVYPRVEHHYFALFKHSGFLGFQKTPQKSEKLNIF